MRFYNTNIKISAVRSLADLFSARFFKNLFVHSSTIHIPDELIVLVFAYELFDINRVFIVVVLPSGRTLRTTTSLNFLSLFIFYFLLLYLFAFLSFIVLKCSIYTS